MGPGDDVAGQKSGLTTFLHSIDPELHTGFDKTHDVMYSNVTVRARFIKINQV